MAEGGVFKFWELLHNDFLNENVHITTGLITAGVMIVSGSIYALTSPRHDLQAAADEAFIPHEGVTHGNIWELIGEFVQGTARDIIGHDYYKYYPLLFFIFTWTLVSNLLGSIPGFGSTTENINTTFGMGVCVFFYYNFMGFKTQGFRYFEQFTGHLSGLLLLILGPVMFVIETISHMIRPLTLGIRLRTNIYADHTVHHTILGMLGEASHSLGEKLGAFGHALGFLLEAILPVPIVLLGLLVCVIQAFVFTLLTIIYIGLATAHDEH